MQTGVFIFATDLTPPLPDLARAIEERGFDLLLLPEHTHIPVARTELSPGGPPLPPEHRRSLDPFIALTAAAAATTRLRVGTGICLVAQRDPITLAKEVATIDLLSGGRFVFGVGFGWHPVEVGNHGVAVAERVAVAGEKVEAMRRIWTSDTAAFEGTHVSFTELWSWPKPVQHPHPPVLVGGPPNRPVLSAVVQYGDGWMPYAYFHDVATGVRRLRQLAEQSGRDPGTIELAVMGCRPAPGDVERFRDMGAGRVVFDLPSEGWDDLRHRLDRYAVLLPAEETT